MNNNEHKVLRHRGEHVETTTTHPEILNEIVNLGTELGS